MRFKANYLQNERPLVIGTDADSSCHEFEVNAWQPDPKDASNVTLDMIALGYSKGTLHGPASSLSDKTIIYPCGQFRCRIGCPCKLCRKLGAHCFTAGPKVTCGDCSQCKSDYEDHLLYHRAHHLKCKFCCNVAEHIPHMAFVVWTKIGLSQVTSWQVTISASLFCHMYKTIPPEKNQAARYQCDKCGLKKA